MDREFAKVFVEGDQKTIFRHGSSKHLLIGYARRLGANPDDILARSLKGFHHQTWYIFVRQQFHRLSRYWVDSLGLEHLIRVFQASVHIFGL